MLATLPIIMLLFIILVITLWIYCKLSRGICKYNGHITGKVVIVTGANSGIGLETAKDLAKRGARVILACRNIERGEIARQQIMDSSDNKDIHLHQLDLESFKSIREFVDNIYRTQSRLDVLINNAGRYVMENKITDDGLPLGMQINYFGPFLLTSLLLPLLKQSAPSRIINVSSFLYIYGKVDFDNLTLETKGLIEPYAVYPNAKLCTMLMTVELSRRLKDTEVTVNCLHPGVVNTNMLDKVDSLLFRTVLKIPKSFFKTAVEGAQTTIYLAVSNEVEKVSGRYFMDCRMTSVYDKGQDLNVARKLWEVSEKLVNLKLQISMLKYNTMTELSIE